MISKKWANILSVFMVIEALILTFGLPPFQKFDEPPHFVRTVALSKGQFFCRDDSFTIPLVYDQLQQDYQFQKVLLENEKFPISVVDFNKKWSDIELKESSKVGRCEMNFLGYIPNAIGVFLTNWTKSPAIIFYAGRIFGFLFLAGMLVLSLKTINIKFKYLLWFYALMPMVIHQATSYSYDVVVVSLALPLITLLINKITLAEEDKNNSLIVWGMVTILSVVKIVYFPIIGLFLLVDWNRLKLKKAKINFILKNILYLGLSLFAIFILLRINGAGSNYPLFVNPTIQRKLVLSDPLYFIRVLISTFSTNWQSLFVETIGVFGWRNTPLSNDFLVYIYIIIGALIFKRLKKDLKGKIGLVEAILGLGILFLVVVLTSLDIYIYIGLK